MATDSQETLTGCTRRTCCAIEVHAIARGQGKHLFARVAILYAVQPQHHLLNDVTSFFAKPLPANNLSSGISIQVPIFDMGRRARAKESAADALRAKVEAEQAEKQNDLAIAELSGSIRELDTQAEIASLKQADRGRAVEDRVDAAGVRQRNRISTGLTAPS